MTTNASDQLPEPNSAPSQAYRTRTIQVEVRKKRSLPPGFKIHAHAPPKSSPDMSQSADGAASLPPASSLGAAREPGLDAPRETAVDDAAASSPPSKPPAEPPFVSLDDVPP